MAARTIWLSICESLEPRDSASNLRERFDVIMFPDQRAEAIHVGYKPGAMPEQYTGGVGDVGAEALKQFASKGGTIMFLNNASEYATQYLGLSVKDALTGISNREFYAPGTLCERKTGRSSANLGSAQKTSQYGSRADPHLKSAGVIVR